jgi:hypothetical protein
MPSNRWGDVICLKLEVRVLLQGSLAGQPSYLVSRPSGADDEGDDDMYSLYRANAQIGNMLRYWEYDIMQLPLNTPTRNHSNS